MPSIYVRNFGPIQEAEIDINRLTLIIGEQASGKSTLAKLVYFFKSLKDQLVALALQDSPVKNEAALIQAILGQFFVFFGSTKRLSDDYRIEFRFEGGLSICCSESPLRIDIGPQYRFDEMVRIVRSYSERISQYRNFADLASEARERVAYREALSRLFSDSQENLYIPASRNITVAYSDSFLAALREELRIRSEALTPGKRRDAKMVDLIIARDFISHTQNLKERFLGKGVEGFLKDELSPSLRVVLQPRIQKLLKGKYRYSDRIGEYFQTQGRENILLEHASSGQQESIRILQDVLVTLSESRNVFRVIEEPEAHLFPSGQQALMEMLATLATSPSQSRMFLTTHSPYILSVVNNLMYAAEVPDQAAKKAGFPPAVRLHPDSVSAYMISQEGIATPMIDPESKLIGANLMEDAWDEINYDFQTLYALDD